MAASLTKDIDPDVAPTFRSDLLEGERLLWCGRPARVPWLTPADGLVIPFGLFFLAFAVFWESNAVSDGGGAFFTAWGLPFIAIGAYIAVGRLFVRKALGHRARYAVTDRRVISHRPRVLGGMQIASLSLATMPAVNVTANRHGFGTVVVGSATRAVRGFQPAFGDPSQGMAPVYGPTVGDVMTLAFIDDAPRVGALVSQAIAAQH